METLEAYQARTARREVKTVDPEVMLILDQLSQPKAKKPSNAVKGFWVRRNGKLEFSASKPKDLAIEAFEGKTGTPVRSRKGRTYVKPNGRRYFQARWWESDRIVSYKV